MMTIISGAYDFD